MRLSTAHDTDNGAYSVGKRLEVAEVVDGG